MPCYQLYGIGTKRINTEGIACSKVFFLYPKGILVKKWDKFDRKITGVTCIKNNKNMKFKTYLTCLSTAFVCVAILASYRRSDLRQQK